MCAGCGPSGNLPRSSSPSAQASRSNISDLERGRHNPTIVSLYELAQALDATPIDLLTPEELV